MKAVVFENYGSPNVLKVKDVEKPTPKANELLIKVYASQINFGDILARKFGQIKSEQFSMPLLFYYPTKLILGIRKPKRQILGSEFAGVIESIGEDVKKFKLGDKVFGYRSMKFGAHAEFLIMSESGLVTHKPDNISFEEAAAIPYGALTALNHLRKLNIQKGQKILINGASGSIGSNAVQLAKYYGAEVTGVCGTPRVDFVKSLGADEVIDYTNEDFTKNGNLYDFIYDVIRKSSFNACKPSLSKNGSYLLVSFKMKQIFQMLWTSIFSEKKVKCLISSEKPEDLEFIKGLIEQGIIKSLIDKEFSMDQATEAHRYVESGNKKGSVVLKFIN